MKINKMWLVLVAAMVLVLSAVSVSAAVTECVDASGNPQAGPGAYPMYNDTGVVTNVTAGNVCVDATSYNIDPNATYNCGNTSVMIDNACTYTTYYTGFLGDGTVACTNAGWVAGTTYTLGEGYIVNTTINASWATRGNYIVDTGEVATYDACSNAYTRQGPDGYCDGGGALDTNDALLNVSAGNVCIAGADTQPTAGVNCDEYGAFVDGACKYSGYYAGYTGDGAATCVITDWVFSVNYTLAMDTIINTTINAPIGPGYVIATGEAATYNACLNAYTRQGPDGYCDGAGALDTNDATLHVTAGKVCLAGVNTAPNATLKCGTWYNCVLDASSAPTYYVGYAGSGTSCDDTSWVASGSTVSFGLQRILVNAHAAVCNLGGYSGNNYVKSDFKPIVLDMMGTAGASFVENAELVVIAIVLLFAAGIFAKWKGYF